MLKLNYCVDCKRIFAAESICTYCKSENVRELKENSPVNVIGTKLKGRVIKSNQDMVQLLIPDEGKSRSIRQLGVDKIRKIL